MKLIKIGKTKLMFETKKAPDGKAFKATDQAMKDAKAIGVGKLVTTQWTDDYNVKSLEEYKPKSSSGYKKSSEGYAEKMVERSVLASISGIVQAMLTAKLLTAKSVQKTIEGLYAGCLELVRGKKEEVKSEATTTDTDEFGETEKDTEFGGGNEETEPEE